MASVEIRNFRCVEQLQLSLAEITALLGPNGAGKAMGLAPLALEDLFVRFNEERTAAGVAVLDQIADTTQILLFAHHDQVALQTASVISADRFNILELV